MRHNVIQPDAPQDLHRGADAERGTQPTDRLPGLPGEAEVIVVERRLDRRHGRCPGGCARRSGSLRTILREYGWRPGERGAPTFTCVVLLYAAFCVMDRRMWTLAAAQGVGAVILLAGSGLTRPAGARIPDLAGVVGLELRLIAQNVHMVSMPRSAR
jgi:hypothetical protein